MSTYEASETLDANDEVCGPLQLQHGQQLEANWNISGTITVTIQQADASGTYFNLPDQSYTASDSKLITGFGTFRLIASGVSGGSAICHMSRGPAA